MGSFSAVVAATSNNKGSSSYTFLLLIVLVFVGFYFLMIRPQRRRQQQAQQNQRTLSPGAEVRTTAGMYATVSAVDGDDVILEVAPGVEVRYMRRAVMEVITPGDEPEETETVTDAHDEGYAEDDVPEDAEDHDHAESAADGLADSHDGNLAKSDKDNVF
ncbi:MAG TPA: preprotein translocase subunit YajC [Streptosporangiaceae bacterium]|nr:preprotein translocase subunit YajC [Streptosporangiaceae bacterium]